MQQRGSSHESMAASDIRLPLLFVQVCSYRTELDAISDRVDQKANTELCESRFSADIMYQLSTLMKAFIHVSVMSTTDLHCC